MGKEYRCSQENQILTQKEQAALGSLLVGTLLLFVYTAIFKKHIALQFALPMNVLLAGMHFPFALYTFGRYGVKRK